MRTSRPTTRASSLGLRPCPTSLSPSSLRAPHSRSPSTCQTPSSAHHQCPASTATSRVTSTSTRTSSTTWVISPGAQTCTTRPSPWAWTTSQSHRRPPQLPKAKDSPQQSCTSPTHPQRTSPSPRRCPHPPPTHPHHHPTNKPTANQQPPPVPSMCPHLLNQHQAQKLTLTAPDANSENSSSQKPAPSVARVTLRSASGIAILSHSTTTRPYVWVSTSIAPSAVCVTRRSGGKTI